jgi:hypothetical protein
VLERLLSARLGEKRFSALNFKTGKALSQLWRGFLSIDKGGISLSQNHDPATHYRVVT